MLFKKHVITDKVNYTKSYFVMILPAWKFVRHNFRMPNDP